MNSKLHRLPQELVNQIAAGEVIERPSSIVKELVDNSIDAGASQIRIKVEKGGIEKIEISDNGVGISKENLPSVFEAHTTSKISSIEDLNNLLTMGFRGEALSTIVSVSNVKIASKTEDDSFGYEVEFDGITPGEIKKSAKEIGTTITVSNIFHNIPAREKFLKTAETEYRKILEIAIPYFIQYPNIHFILQKDGKEIYNLPQVSDIHASELNVDRIKAVIKSSFTQSMFPFRSGGAGVEITGYCAHPKDNVERTGDQYIFINKRSVWDFGVAKSIKSAFSRYIPHNRKVPFIINITIDPKLIDVNVHPRKEEIRFENPYRVYSAIESAVLASLENLLKDENGLKTNYSSTPIEYRGGAGQGTAGVADRSSSPYKATNMFTGGASNEITFNNNRRSVNQGLEFSKQLIEMKKGDNAVNTDYNRNNIDLDQTDIDINKVFQIFNKYIVIEHGEELIMIDQHAAAERITFEKLEGSLESQNLDQQNLLMPIELPLSEIECSFLEENKEFFTNLMFTYTIDNNTLSITSVPSIFSEMNIEELFKSIFEISEDQRDMKKSFESAKQNILASLACHGSIRKGQKLSPYEGMQVYKDLVKCKNPYSCPHGRPAIWKQRLSEIDSNFYRTY